MKRMMNPRFASLRRGLLCLFLTLSLIPVSPFTASALAERPIDLVLDMGPRIGWGLYFPKPSLLRLAGLPKGSKGILVVNVAEKTPAETAGFQAGDLIVGINDQSIENFSKAANKAQRLSYEPMRCQIQRRTETLQLTVTPLPGNEIHSGEFNRIQQQTKALANLFEALGLSEGPHGNFEESLRAKHQIYRFYKALEAEALQNGKPLNAEKFRLLSNDFR